MLLRTVDKHLICTVFTAPILVIVIYEKHHQKSHLYLYSTTLYYVKKYLLLLMYLYIITELLLIWFRNLYLHLRKKKFTTTRLFLECSSYTLLYSLLQYFHQFFHTLVLVLPTTPKIFQVTTSHLNLTHLHTIFIYT